MRNDSIFTPTIFQHHRQDTERVVLLSFCLFLVISPALPHAHASTSLSVLLCLGVLRAKNNRVFQGEIPTNVKLYLLFYCFSLSSVILAVARTASLLSAVLRLSFFLPFFLSERNRVRVLLALLGGMLGVWALCELWLGGGMQGTVDEARFSALARATGPFQNPNALAAFLLPAATFSLVLALFGTRMRMIFSLSYLSAVAGIAATFSRGAMVSLLVVSLWLFCKKFGASRMFAASLSLFPLLLFLLPDSVKTRLSSLGAPDSSVSYRFSLWQSALHLPLRSLIFGAGEGRAAMHALLFPVLAAGLSHVEHMHSLFLQVLISGGFVGLFLFLACLASALWRGKSDSVALLSLLLFGLFDTPLYYPQTEVIFWLITGLCASQNKDTAPSY